MKFKVGNRVVRIKGRGLDIGKTYIIESIFHCKGFKSCTYCSQEITLKEVEGKFCGKYFNKENIMIFKRSKK